MKWTKDPAAVLPYEMDWSAWLTAEGDAIAACTVTVAPAGQLAVLDSPAPSATDGVVRWWMTGGVAGAGYRVTVHIQTTGGREDERSVPVECVER